MPFAATDAQSATHTLVALFAHPDDEVAVAPLLARYAREGVQIYEIYVTGGEAGAGPGSDAAALRHAQGRGGARPYSRR